jgi:hypothetical protein
VGGEVGRYRNYLIGYSQAHHVHYWESVDSWLPNKVGIKHYHHDKVIDIDRGRWRPQPARYVLNQGKYVQRTRKPLPGVPVWGLTFGNISIHGGRVWKPLSKQPQGRDSK